MAAEKVTKAAPTAPNADKKRAIETAMAQIEKLYGANILSRIEGAYRILPFFGDDIRKQKK